MTLLADVHQLLDDEGIAHAVIGAAALAVRGVARSTMDLDLLTADERALDDRTWKRMSRSATVRISRGDASDPLVGVVRISTTGERWPLDLVVGHPWTSELVARATMAEISDVELRVVTPFDLVLLKLYAGGPQDAWDIDQLLDVDDGIAAEVERRVGALPPSAGALWNRIVRDRVSR